MKDKIIFWICFGLSATLIVTGFILPPMGVIDNSVLVAVGELFAFGTLFEIPKIVKNGRVTLRKGNTQIDIDPED